MQSNFHTFYADAVLFDMDGTLTNSIAAVEAAWGKVAKEIGQDPSFVINATHGKRAVDNLAHFKPSIHPHEMDAEVQRFEETILFFADAYTLHGPGSGSIPYRSSSSQSDGASYLSPSSPYPPSPLASAEGTPELVISPPGSLSSSRTSSFVTLDSRRPSFASRLNGLLDMSIMQPSSLHTAVSCDPGTWIADEDVVDVLTFEPQECKTKQPCLEQWQIEAARVDRRVRILPGVRTMLDSIPESRYAVATSGAKTYAFGCMRRVGIIPPKVTITADDSRLKAGKPAPDPFLLAARELGFAASDCVVFEDSPSGIHSGLASGATVIAVCTSHERKQIEHIGAHFVVEDMESVKCEVCENGRLKFSVHL